MIMTLLACLARQKPYNRQMIQVGVVNNIELTIIIIIIM